MNLIDFIIVAVVAVVLFFAIKSLCKKGSACSGCKDGKCCSKNCKRK